MFVVYAFFSTDKGEKVLNQVVSARQQRREGQEVRSVDRNWLRVEPQPGGRLGVSLLICGQCLLTSCASEFEFVALLFQCTDSVSSTSLLTYL